MKAETITGVNEIPLEEGEKKGKAEKKAGKRIGYNYIVVKSLKEHRKNDVVKCLYIKSLTKWGFCVIKEGTIGDSTDKYGRDIRDRLVWQKKMHEALKYHIRLPALLGSFEENGNYYLVIEHIPGQSLGTMIRKEGQKLRKELIGGGKTAVRFVRFLIEIVELLVKLHQEGIVHRDATSGNFIVTNSGKVAIIDFELSYSLDQQFPQPPFELGTNGFMSPQQEERLSPTFEEDIFALGAVVLQLWTSISPSKLTRPPGSELNERVAFCIPDKKVADIIARCLDKEPAKRPSLVEVKNALVDFRKDLSRKKSRPTSVSRFICREELLDVIQQGITTMCSSSMADKDKGWFAPNPASIGEDAGKMDKGYYGSFMYGVAGPVYLMNRASIAGLDTTAALPHIQHALELIERKYINKEISTSSGLYYGSGGIAITLQESILSGVIDKFPHREWIMKLLNRISNVPGVFDGRAGQGISMLSCLSAMDQLEGGNRLQNDFDFISTCLQDSGVWEVEVGKKNKRKVYPGFLYGNAGTIFFLLQYGSAMGNDNAILRAQDGLNWMMGKVEYKNNHVIWKSPSGHRIGYAWAEGAAGIALSYLKAWEVTGNQSYRIVAESALRGINEQIFDNNLTQFDGLSGLGEIFLEAFRVLKDDYWLKRASWITQVIYNTRILHPKYGIYWQGDHEKYPTAGFMRGNSGVMHFLLRFCFPELFQYPLIGGGQASLESYIRDKKTSNQIVPV